MNAKAASLSDIARRLGISRRSVAQALNGSDRGTVKVSEATARRVRELAAELGYRGNAAARAVATGRFNAIGLVLSTDASRGALAAATLHGIQEEMLQRDMHLTLGQVPDAKLTADNYLPRLLREWSVDGLVISYSVDMPPKILELLRTYRLPSVWLNIDLPNDAVRPDDLQGGKAATEHLLSLGHRRICYVDRDANRHYSGAARRAGYELTMVSAGLRPWVVASDSFVPAVKRLPLHAELLSLPASQRPTAVITYGDVDAQTMYVAALKAGIDVPRELSIMTFHSGVPVATGLGITCMRIPAYEVGRRAVQLLSEKINGRRESVPSVLLPFELRQGESTATPPA